MESPAEVGSELGALIAERLRALGLNQTTLSKRTDGELRQNYISQVIRAEIGVPQGRKAELFREHLAISREDWFRAAGMLDELDKLDDNDIERDQVFALMMAHKQAGPMLLRLKAEASVDEYPALLDEALEHFAVGLGRQLRRRREEGGGA